MSYIDPTDNVECKLTDVARNYHARAALGELSFHLVGFSAGRYGYQDANPVKIFNVNTADTALTDSVYPVVGTYAAFVRIEEPLLGVVAPVCRIDRADCTYAIGEIGIWAQIDFCTSPPPNAGDTFLYAIAHQPILGKSNTEVFVFRVLFTY